MRFSRRSDLKLNRPPHRCDPKIQLCQQSLRYFLLFSLRSAEKSNKEQETQRDLYCTVHLQHLFMNDGWLWKCEIKSILLYESVCHRVGICYNERNDNENHVNHLTWSNYLVDFVWTNLPAITSCHSSLRCKHSLVRSCLSRTRIGALESGCNSLSQWSSHLMLISFHGKCYSIRVTLIDLFF